MTKAKPPPKTNAARDAKLQSKAARVQQRRALPLPVMLDVEEELDAPTILSAKLILALLREECDPTVAGVTEYLETYRSTAYRLLSRLADAGILTRRVRRRLWVPPMLTFQIAPEWLPAKYKPPKDQVQGEDQ